MRVPRDPDARGPLDGIRVADFSRVLAGPYATMMLADFGADVIKIEGPAGDDTRQWKPPTDTAGRSTYFASVNRNKRSVALDLNDPGDRESARTLAVTADVVIENFKPGGLDRFGLDYASIAAANPATVYCSISGFGDEAGATLPGYDLLAQAVGGLMSITGHPGGEPTKVGVALVDVLTGMNAVIGIQAALRERDRTGVGQQVKVNLLHSLLAALTNQASSALATGLSPRALGNAHPSIAPYETFRASDRPIVVAVGNDRQFRSFAEVLGMSELADSDLFARNIDRVGNRDALRAIINDKLAARSSTEWIDALAAVGVPSGPVNTVLEAIELAAELGLQPTVAIGDSGYRGIRNPITLTSTPARYRSAPPDLPAAHGRIDWLPKENRHDPDH
ncbi:MAG: CoA transferase [Microterricola sp.]